MPTRHELPGDHWVEIKDPIEVTERERKPIRRAYLATVRTLRGPAPKRGQQVVDSPDPTAPPEPEDEGFDPLDPERLDVLDDYQHQLMAFFVHAWDFGFDPTPESVQDLPVPCYRELDALVTPLTQELIHGIKPEEPAAEEEEVSHPSEP